MSQPPPSQYGRTGQGSYGYAGGGGYPPQGAPQQEPSRYFTTGPHGKFLLSSRLQHTPLTHQASRTPQPQNPPQNGPAPFYVVGQGPPQQSDPRSRTPSGTKPAPAFDPYAAPPQQHRPQSTYDNPQELGTSAYDSPVDTHGRPPQAYPAQSQQPQHSIPHNHDYPPHSNYPPGADAQGPYQAQQPPVGPGQGHDLPPSHQPPQAPSPNLQNPYPILNSGPPGGGMGAPPAGGYQAYQAPRPQQQQQYAAGAGVGAGTGAGPGANPNDFYR